MIVCQKPMEGVALFDSLGFRKFPFARVKVSRESPAVIVPAVVAPENSSRGRQSIPSRCAMSEDSVCRRYHRDKKMLMLALISSISRY